MTREEYIAQLRGISTDGLILINTVFSELVENGNRDFSKLSVDELIKIADIGLRAWQLAPVDEQLVDFEKILEMAGIPRRKEDSECIEHSPN